MKLALNFVSSSLFLQIFHTCLHSEQDESSAHMPVTSKHMHIPTFSQLSKSKQRGKKRWILMDVPCHRTHGMTQSPLPNIATGFKTWNGSQSKRNRVGTTPSRSWLSQRSGGSEVWLSERFICVWVWSNTAPHAAPQKALGRGEAQTNMLL